MGRVSGRVTSQSVTVPARPRVGHIQFLNCLPIYWGLMRSGALLDVDLHKDTPDRLNDDAGRRRPRHRPDLAGRVPAARRRAAAAARPRGRQRRAGALGEPGLHGAARPSWTGAGWRSAPRRAPACCWPRCCWRRSHGVRPEYFRCPPDLTEMLLEADAAVLIGDAALRRLATRRRRDRGLVVHRSRRGLARLDRPADGLRGLGRPPGLRRRQPRAGQGRARGVRPLPGRAWRT